MRKIVSSLIMALCVAITICITGCGGGSNAPNNSVTAANAGSIQNVRALSLVTLDGSNSTGANGKLITYNWSFSSKPSGSSVMLSNANVVNPTFVPDVPGTYILSLIVHDGTANSTPSTVTITVSQANSAPVAHAGSNQNATVGNLITLDGSLSSDADNDLLTYKWSISAKPAGSTANLSKSTVVNPTITADVPGNYTFNLVVNDGYVDSAASAVTVTVSKVNSVPVANAGSAQSVVAGSVVTLDGSKSSDADGDLITYSWSFTSKPNGSNAALSDFTAVNPTFTADVAGAYVLNLVVNDGKANSPSVPVTINVAKQNTIPVANAGTLQNVVQGSIVTLDGSKSIDADGDLITYKWSFASVPAGSVAPLVNSTSVNPTFTTDAVGAYVLNLVVNDGKTDSAVSTVTINAAKPNSAPIADAGAIQNVLKGVVVTLDGSKSSDADGDALTYSWSFVSKPLGSGSTLSSLSVINPTFTPDVVGAYVLRLIVNDGKVNSAASTVTINVARTNVAPSANAGANQNAFTGNVVTLNGSASSDADGDPLIYKWALSSRPVGSTVVLASTSVVNPTFIPDVAGAYVFALTVNDGIIDSAVSIVTINVTKSNSIPVANAGIAQSVKVANLVTLDGSGSSDADGDILSYSWILVTQPSGSSAVLSNSAAMKPTFTPNLAGNYIFQLVVYDGKAYSLAANVTITAVSPVLQLSQIDTFFGTTTNLTMPYSMSGTSTAVVSGISVFTVDTFKLTATAGDFTISNLSAIDSTGRVVPYFSGLANNQIITAGSSVTFKLMSPLTNNNTANITYKFTVLETGKTFTYNVQLKTN